MDSILQSVKKMLGIEASYTQFDTDIIIHINSTLMILTQLGVGPSSGFSISGRDETWEEFAGDNPNIEGVKSYVYMKVKMMFDPPLSSSVAESINRLINEFEWRLNVAVDPPNLHKQ